MPPPPMPPGPVPPPKNNKNRNIVLAIIGATVVVCLLGCCVVGLFVADRDGNNDDADQQSEPDNDQSDSDSSQEDEDEETATIDDKVSDGDFEFVVTALEDGVTEVGDDVLGSTPQGQFVLIDVTVENTGDSAEMFSDSLQKVFDTDGKEYSADSEAAIYIEDNQVLLEDINPGNSIDAQLVFDVPEDSELDSIQLHSTAISSGVTVSLS